MSNDIKKKDLVVMEIANSLFYIYLGLGLGLLIGVVFAIYELEVSQTISDIEDFRKLVSTYLPPMGVLLASQIAGFAVVRTINNTNKLENTKKIEEAKKSKKVLNAYFRHLQSLGSDQINMLDELIKYINSISNVPLSHANLEKIFYDDNTNLLVFIKPIESMLSPDLHKYIDVEVMDYILNLKVQVVKMMQSTKLIHSVFIPANRHQELLSLLIQMKSETQEILDSANPIIEKL